MRALSASTPGACRALGSRRPKLRHAPCAMHCAMRHGPWAPGPGPLMPRGRGTGPGARGHHVPRTPPAGAKKHQHARCEATREQTGSARTGGEGGASAGIQRHIWLRGLSPAGKVLTGCSACGYAARSSLRSRRPSGPKPPI
jgi:hypothetical protein